jgi:hypothetical protein
MKQLWLEWVNDQNQPGKRAAAGAIAGVVLLLAFLLSLGIGSFVWSLYLGFVGKFGLNFGGGFLVAMVLAAGGGALLVTLRRS